MADPSLTLLAGGIILLVGFGAYLAFQRYHVPDCLILIVLGAVLPSTEGTTLLSILPTSVLLSTLVCAGLFVWAGRAPVSAEGGAKAGLSVSRQATANTTGGGGPPDRNAEVPAGEPPPVTAPEVGGVSRREPPPGPTP